MNELKIFENEQFGSIRTVEIDSTPYFVGKDVADIVKMCIVFMPVIAMAVVSIIAGITELIKNRKNGNG